MFAVNNLAVHVFKLSVVLNYVFIMSVTILNTYYNAYVFNDLPEL